MALIANYNDLKSAVAEWLGREGDAALAARADEFIALFEAEFVLDPDMRTFEMEQVHTTSVVDADPVALPAGFISMTRLVLTDADGAPKRKLTYVTPDKAADLDLARPASSTANHYTIIAGSLVFAPRQSPPVGDKLEMSCYVFNNLSDTNTTNWLLEKYRNIYLYGSLAQAAAYVDDKATVSLWSTGLSAAIAKLSKSDKDRKAGAGPLTMRPSIRSFR
jgi:hypothetical protein